VRVWRTRTGISIIVLPADRRRLAAVVNDRNAPQKHVWRCRIVVLAADGVGTNAIKRRTGKSKTCVWRWQERFAREGFEGLLRDKTRPSRVKPLGDETVARIVALTLDDPPGETTHWTGALMAKVAGISASSVQRIWRAHRLRPHRVRQFKLSNDPKFVAKLHDVVGLYVDPPAHANVLSVDEKSQIQALDRTQPGLPLKKGRLGTMTHYAIERLHEEFKRRIKTQTVLPSADTAAMLFWGLLAPGAPDLADPAMMGGTETRLAHPRIEAEVAHRLLGGLEPADIADRPHQPSSDSQVDACDRHQPPDCGILDHTLRDLAIKSGEVFGEPVEFTHMTVDGNTLVVRQQLARQPVPTTSIEQIDMRAFRDQIRMVRCRTTW
jgi:transposase